MLEQHYPFILAPLPYPYNLLEPYIDTQTMHLHHDHHMKAYVDKLNALLANYPAYQNWTLTQLITQAGRLPAAIREGVRANAGGVYNHQFYFQNMTPARQQQPSAEFQKALAQSFGSISAFQSAMNAAGLARLGSGWVWLIRDRSRELKILSTANQDTPLGQNRKPLLCIDVWEHAYYLKYKYQRNRYLEYWWNIANYAFAEERWRQ